MALAAQMAAAKDELVEDAEDNEAFPVNWQMLKGCLASLGSWDRLEVMEVAAVIEVVLVIGGLKAPRLPTTAAGAAAVVG